MFRKLFGGKVPPHLEIVTVEDLARQPELKAIGDRIAAQILERRTALAAQLVEVTGERADARCAGAWRALHDQEAKVAEAKTAYEAACEKREEARARLTAFTSRIEVERRSLEGALITTADPRIERFGAWLEELFMGVRHGVTMEFEPPPPPVTAAEFNAASKRLLEKATANESANHRMNGWVPGLADLVRPGSGKQKTNAREIENILSAILRLRPEVAATKLEPLSTEEVTARLEGWCESLRGPLSRADQGIEREFLDRLVA